jgi:hypothetical protein
VNGARKRAISVPIDAVPGDARRHGPADHQVRVIDAFVDGLDLAKLGFTKAEAAGRRPSEAPQPRLGSAGRRGLSRICASLFFDSICRR